MSVSTTRAATAFGILVIVWAVWTPAYAQLPERATATTSLQLYEAPPQAVPFFPFLLSSPTVLEGETVEPGKDFRIMNSETVNSLGERSLWVSIQADGQQGWIYAGRAGDGGTDNNPRPWLADSRER